MDTINVVAFVFILGFVSYYMGYKRVFQISRKTNINIRRFHSRPRYYGLFLLMVSALPSSILIFLWLSIEPFLINKLILAKLKEVLPNLTKMEQSLWLDKVKAIASGKGGFFTQDPNSDMLVSYYLYLKDLSRKMLAGSVTITGIGSLIVFIRKLSPVFRARQYVEQIITVLLGCFAVFAIFITLSIVVSVLFESLRFFKVIPFWDFLLGTRWSPQIAIRADQVASSGSFGSIPVFVGTFLISFIALAVAVPTGLLAAIYMSEYASRSTRKIVKPLMEMLAGVPTVVYGFFAAIIVGPTIRSIGEGLGLSVSSESALSAGLIMGFMIIPFISSVSDDAISVVPQSLRDGAFALGSTKSEMIKKVLLPAALPGIAGGVLLAVSRAIGETMIVVMAAGLNANLTLNPFESVTTVTVQIVTLLTGDQEFDSPKTLAAFALGLVLFVITLTLNIVALYIVRKYREQYE